MTPEEARRVLDDPDIRGAHRHAIDVLIEEAVAAERERCAAVLDGYAAADIRKADDFASVANKMACYASANEWAAAADRIREGGAT